MADLLSTTRSELEERLRELRPLVAEAARLERALGALSGLDSGGAVAPAARRRPRDTSPEPGGRRRGAPRGRRAGATRANQFLEIVRQSPGISIAGAAEQMGTAPNYLYRIANGLQQEGVLERRGRGFAVAAGAPADPQPRMPDGSADTGAMRSEGRVEEAVATGSVDAATAEASWETGTADDAAPEEQAAGPAPVSGFEIPPERPDPAPDPHPAAARDEPSPERAG